MPPCRPSRRWTGGEDSATECSGSKTIKRDPTRQFHLLKQELEPERRLEAENKNPAEKHGHRAYLIEEFERGLACFGDGIVHAKVST